jgi:hypothetical protein
VGRYKIYRSDKALREAVEGYFSSISRLEPVMEARNTGEKDAWGHWVYEWAAVHNDDGAPIYRREYAVPPTVGGLCQYLDISRDTWERYCDSEANPQFAETTRWARERLLAWREEQLLTRDGKTIRGLIFDLQANYGMREQAAPAQERGKPQAAAPEAMPLQERERLLREIAAQFGGNGGGERGQ